MIDTTDDAIKLQTSDDWSKTKNGRAFCRFQTAYEAKLALRMDGKKQNIRIRACSDQEFDAAMDSMDMRYPRGRDRPLSDRSDSGNLKPGTFFCIIDDISKIV